MFSVIMKALMPINKQKELFLESKSRLNLTWSSFSEKLNVSEHILKSWAYGKSLVPVNILEQLDIDGRFKKYVLEIKHDFWGCSKGGLKSRGNTKSIIKPNFDEDLSEFIGIILGDGNLHAYKKGKKVRTYMVRIAGHSEQDNDYLSIYVLNLSKKLFGVQPKIYKSKRSNAMYLIIHSKEIIDFMSNIGLMCGNKVLNQPTMPKWVREDNYMLMRCLRGLIDTDGSIFRMSRRDNKLLRISFKNYNSKLLRDVRDAFMKLEYSPSKIINNEVFYLSKQKDIKKYIKDIGFKNKKHIKRLQSIAP